MNSILDQWLTEPSAASGAIIAGVPVAPAESTWWESLARPWTSFATGISESAGRVYEQLPERLFEWGMGRLGGSESRVVPQGAGTTITYTQPAGSGGAPADPNYIVLPPYPQQPSAGGIVQVPAAAAGVSMGTMLVIGLVLFLVLRK